MARERVRKLVVGHLKYMPHYSSGHAGLAMDVVIAKTEKKALAKAQARKDEILKLDKARIKRLECGRPSTNFRFYILKELKLR